MIIFDLLKAGRGEGPTAAPHYVITTDFETLGRIKEAATFMATNAQTFPEIRDSVEIVAAIDKSIAEAKAQL